MPEQTANRPLFKRFAWQLGDLQPDSRMSDMGSCCAGNVKSIHKVDMHTTAAKVTTIAMPVEREYSPEASGRYGLLTCTHTTGAQSHTHQGLTQIANYGLCSSLLSFSCFVFLLFVISLCCCLLLASSTAESSHCFWKCSRNPVDRLLFSLAFIQLMKLVGYL